jgi:hypothetical protein
LIDNPPNVQGKELAELQATRILIRDLNKMFQELAAPFIRECDAFLARRNSASAAAEITHVALLYQQAARRIEFLAESYSKNRSKAFAHHDAFFTNEVLKKIAFDHRARGRTICEQAHSLDEIDREYRRLASLFRVEIVSFERKRYDNLSHVANKAMNLNSYIGLMGGSYREKLAGASRLLVECEEHRAEIHIPDSDYVLTLDADSVVRPDYALRLAKLLDDNPNMAVAQTPYSAFPGAPNALERLAGATTDLQYVVHQGFTRWEATYWVGANALIRMAALRDIEQRVSERGYMVPVFIQDRTVIEDTESTVDLIARGWTLHNYPERLAYSATPPDFGSLVIQRRRWANGGLIILPKLARYLRDPLRTSGHRLAEAFMRLHYLCSPALGSLALLVILIYPFDDSLTSPWLIATSVPYGFLYGRDLRQNGYRFHDVLRVYSLTLLLLSVNLSGVVRSLRQIITGRKSAFGRTPKVEGRTVSPPTHLCFQWALLACLALSVMISTWQLRFGHAVFSVLNFVALLYGMHRFVGFRNAMLDFRASRLEAKAAREKLWKPTVGKPSGVVTSADRKDAQGTTTSLLRPIKTRRYGTWE